MEARLAAALTKSADVAASPDTEYATADSAEPLDEAVDEAVAVVPAADDDGPPLPSEAEEAAMISEMRDRGEPLKPVAPPPDAEDEVDSKAKLPSLDSLVKQVPPDVIETLDELFRAKWVGVRKVPKAVLKDG